MIKEDIRDNGRAPATVGSKLMKISPARGEGRGQVLSLRISLYNIPRTTQEVAMLPDHIEIRSKLKGLQDRLELLRGHL
jgi:hypothetical protein